MEEPDWYKVEVVHFISPFLIWVEVPDSTSQNGDKYCFEQIGVHGVLPLEMTMEIADNTLTTRRSSDWMPAAVVLMNKLLAEAAEITFCPLHIEHSSTVFDDNIHKYGEIVIKKQNGKYKLLSKLLVKYGYATYDPDAFQAELSSGHIKIKMSHSMVKDVIKQLEKKCKAQIAKQTKVFQVAQSIESALTVKNLEAHNRRNKIDNDEFEEILQRKLEDLQWCKNAEQKSVGRASKKKETESDSSSLLLKKVKLLKGGQSGNAPDVVNIFKKQRNDDLRVLLKSTDSEELQHAQTKKDSNKTDPDAYVRIHKVDINDVKQQKEQQPVNGLKKLQMALKKAQPIMMGDIMAVKKMQSKISKNSNADGKTKAHSESLTTVSTKEVKSDNKISGSDMPKCVAAVSTKEVDSDKIFSGSDMIDHNENFQSRKAKKPKRSPNKIPAYDIHKEKRVVYGPPGTNMNVLSCKIVPKDSNLETNDPPEPKEESIPMKIEKEDIFNDEDSDVDTGTTLQQVNRVSDKIESSVSHSVDSNSHATSNNSKLDKDLPSESYFEVLTPQLPSENNYTSNSILKYKLRHHKKNLMNKITGTDSSDTSVKDSSTSTEECKSRNYHKSDGKKNSSEELDSDDDNVVEKINSEYVATSKPKIEVETIHEAQLKNNVNPFKNADANISKFVEKLVTPILMVHSKMNKRFLPVFNLRDIPFSTFIHIILKNMSIEKPMMIQTITWASILRGYSTFIIAPKNSGKTMGYLPAVCRLVADQDSMIEGVGPISIIVCATSNSVSEIEVMTKLFSKRKERVLAIYTGLDEMDIATSLLNGCDILICTPAILVRLLLLDFGVDLRRLTSFVLDDCERLTEVFANEIKFFLSKIKEMLKTRVPKVVQVQYIVSSRIWCDFMESLSKKAPNTVICIGAFQECVLYSKASTTASFVTKENKLKSVLDFLKDIDHTKRSVIVCRTDEEVAELEKALTANNYVVFACDSEMTVQNLYNLKDSWDNYQEPVIGPILVCLDGNLTHLNVTDAHYLIHYSLPTLFSSFCKRFSAINDNYNSIFKEDNNEVKIKILLEDSNVEQLPKILHFIKRCTTQVPAVLDVVCDKILMEKDKAKAMKLVPICHDLLTLGECPDFWNCQDRHAVNKDIDEPQDWVPKEGTVTFKIVHYHTAVFYSARLLTHSNKGQTHKYQQNYNMLAMKISMYFGRESNRRLHTDPEVGDICAVSIKQNFFARCQVVKILNYYQNGKPNYVLVRLIDEEKLEKTRDIYLHYLPEELKTTQTHVVHVRLANLKPKDKDITFSNLAKEELKKISEEEDLYMRGHIALTIGNCVILESIEACRDLSILNKTVVLHDFKDSMLEKHAQVNNEHLQKLRKLCLEGGMEIPAQMEPEVTEVVQPTKQLPTPQWAHLEKDDLSSVYFGSAENPSTFFVRLVKFEAPCSILVKDIQKYVAENNDRLNKVDVGDIVLAKLPDDDMFERARIDEIVNDDKVKCFFVDQGDWREVSKLNLVAITEHLITQLPFQAIECRLVGVKPPGNDWTEFATNWFTNCFEDNAGNLKQIYVKFFTKEKSQYTGGHKYGVVLVDTNTEQDVIINESIMEVNLAQPEDNEIQYLDKLDFSKVAIENPKSSSGEEDAEESWEEISEPSRTSLVDVCQTPKFSLNDVFLKQPIRSVPLVGSDESETSEDRWQINMPEEFMGMFKPEQKQNNADVRISNLPAIKNADSACHSEVSDNQMPCKNQSVPAINESDTDSSILVIPTPKVKEIDSDDYTSPESATEELLKEITTKTKTESKNTETKDDSEFKPTDNSDVSLRKPKVLWHQNKNTETKDDSEFKPTDNSDVSLRKPKVLWHQNKNTETKDDSEFKPTDNSDVSLRKPKVLWHQNKNSVTIKIQLIGVDKYNLKIEERELKFYTVSNDTEYGFNLDFYGIVDKKNAIHSNKGQYIWIHLLKVVERNWLTLTRSGGIKKWIVYDVDSIDVVSTDESDDDNMSRNVIKSLCNNRVETDSEEEDEFLDDVNFGYKR